MKCAFIAETPNSLRPGGDADSDLHTPAEKSDRPAGRAARRNWRVTLPACALLVGASLVGAAPDPTAQIIAVTVEAPGDARSGALYVANPDGSGLRRLGRTYGRLRAPALSPDGKWVACQTSDDLGLDTLVLEPVTPGPDAAARRLTLGSHPQWSRDGSQILFARRQSNDYNLYVIRADGRQREETLKPLVKGQIGRWSPDEKQLAIVAPVILEGMDRWQIQVLPADTLKPRLRLTLPESFGQVLSLDWSAQADRLLFTVHRREQLELYLVDLKTLEPLRVPVGEGAAGAAFGAWSPDGTRILFRAAGSPGSAGSGQRLCVMRANGADVRVLWEPPNRGVSIQGAAWSGRPTTLASAPLLPPAAPKPAPPAPKPPAAKPPLEPPPVVVPKPSVPPGAPQSPGPWKQVRVSRRLRIDLADSPVSIPLVEPGDTDFQVRATMPAQPGWKSRRQGLGITIQLASGALYRGTVIHNDGSAWVTVQGRAQPGPVRLLDGKRLPAASAGYRAGFELVVRRDAKKLRVLVNGEIQFERPLLIGAVRQVSLTLENFDAGLAGFPLSEVSYQVWGEQK